MNNSIRRIKRILAAALALLLGLGVYPVHAEILEAPPFVASIDHYVVELDTTAYITEPELACYKRLMDAIFAREEEVRLLDSYDSNLNVLSLALKNPYRFLVKRARLTDDHRSIRLSYAYTAAEQEEMIAFIDGEFLSMFDEILELDMTDLEKVLAVHGYFASHIEYDYAYAEELSLSDEQFLYPEIEIYEALQTGKGVCHSYTYLCEFALQQLDIDCLRLTAEISDTEEGHMWLAVRLDGEWYHVDPTWDRDGDCVSLRYFGMNDAERIASGIEDSWNVGVDMNFGPIECTSERFSSLWDVYDYRMLGGHKMEVWREEMESPEIIDLRKL